LSLITAGLSRRDEFEADAYATALMIRSGLGAEAQARMLEKLTELVPGSKAASASWLASHPPVDERARAIRANAARYDQSGDGA
ncbi:MAG: M48 family metalloprotease, partial [Pseudomonadota bacterium]